MLKRILQYIGTHGASYTLYHAGELLYEHLHHDYDRMWRTELCPSEADLEQQRNNIPQGVGRISVVIPVYNTKPELLKELAESLLAQTYPDWQACMYDGCSTRPETGKMLREIAAMDSRFTITFGEKNEGIAGNSNLALDTADGEWIALCDHDDLLTPDALWQVARVIRDEKPELIYSDEDKIDEAGQIYDSPNFKPDFCPDDLRSGNYVCHLMVMSRDLINRAGRFRAGFDGSQDHDLTLRCIEQTDRVAHIPKVLYHWRTLQSSASHSNLAKCNDAACKAVEEHINRIGWPGRVEKVNGQPRIFYKVKPGAKMDVITIESGDPQQWGAFYHELRRMEGPDISFTSVSPWRDSSLAIKNSRWIEWNAKENIYAALNRAAEAAEGEYLLFLHGSVAMEGDRWMEELQMYAQREDVGAVTPVLLSQMGHIIHGGFAVGVDNVVACRGKGLPQGTGGWHGMMTTSHNVSAVSAACLMIRKDHFIPFDENYRGGLGCVDWCLRLQQKGMRHVFTPHAAGRVKDEEMKHWLLMTGKPDEQDAALFRQTWGDAPHDPCYSATWRRTDARWKLPKMEK